MALNLDYLALMQAAFRLGPTIKDIVDEAATNDEIVTKVTKLSGPVAAVLAEVGAAFFPQVAPALHIAAAVTASFDPSVTKWVQSACNKLCQPSPDLVVDGIYGPRTKAAVEQLQKQLGLSVDGWAGQITQAAIAKLLTSVK